MIIFMKKNLFYLLILAVTVMNTACSSDDPVTGGQDYTSFTVKNTINATYKNMIVGYFAKDGKCKKIAELGDIAYNQTSAEIKITNSDITEVYLFYSPSIGESYKMDLAHKIKKGKKNEIIIEKNYNKVSANPKDDTQFPH